MSKTAYKEIVQEIVRRVSLIDGTGRVHGLTRIINESSKLKELLFDETQDKICGWLITRQAPITNEKLTNEEFVTVSQFVLAGYYSLQEGSRSEDDFQQMIDNVMFSEHLNALDNLSGLCEDTSLLQARVIGTTTIGGSLVHYCELTLDVQELISN